MTIILVLISLFIGVSILSASSITTITRAKCNERGDRHEWVVKGFDEDTYLVCKKCKLLPSGETEEGNDKYEL